MSSLRNAVKRITHKERGQPQKRSHLGILEKKKDYKGRAVDYHRKQDRLNSMRERASMRNPDEFYFGMHNSKVENGKHRRTEEAERKLFEQEIGLETVRIMKDQDLQYVRTQRQKDKKKIQKLQSNLHLLDGINNGQRKHTVFVDSKEDVDSFDTAEFVNKSSEERLRKAAEAVAANFKTKEEAVKWAKEQRKIAKRAAKARAAAYEELNERTTRVEAMRRAEAHLETERMVAAKGRKRKIKGAENGEPAVYKWRRKRVR